MSSPVQWGLTQWKGHPEVRMGRPGAVRETEMVVTAQPIKAMNEQPSLGESDWSFSAGLTSVSLLSSQFCYDCCSIGSPHMDICGEIYLLMGLFFPSSFEHQQWELEEEQSWEVRRIPSEGEKCWCCLHSAHLPGQKGT